MSFLLELVRVLRPFADPLDVQEAATRLLGETLGADRVFYIIFEDDGEFFRIDRGYHTAGAPLALGRQRNGSILATHMRQLRAGMPLVIPDVRLDRTLTSDEVNTYTAIGIRAHITVPLLKGGRLAALLAIHSIQPRAWTAREAKLIEQFASFTWIAVERASAEKALRLNEERSRIILENTSDGITMLDVASGRYVYLSPKAVEMTGYSAEELHAMGLAGMDVRIHPEDRDLALRLRQRVASGIDEFNDVEYRWQRKDGEYRWVSDRRRLVRDENGRPLALVGVNRDITRLKETERILQETMRDMELRTRELVTVINSMPDGLTLYDRDINPVFMNEPASRFFKDFGLQPQLPAAERIAAARVHDRSGRKLTLQEWPTYITFTTGTTIKDFIIMTWPSPSAAVYYSVSTAPVREEGGQTTGIVALVQDITERIRNEERLKASESKALALVGQLQEADRHKDRFISMLSHELRNPLAAIALSISLMERVSAEDRHYQRARDVIKRQSGQLARLVDDLLDVTRINENRVVLKKERVELGELIRRAIADFQQQFADKGVALVTDLAGAPVHLEADPVRITQVIGNILHNATKFTNQGDTVAVSLKTEACLPPSNEAGPDVSVSTCPVTPADAAEPKRMQAVIRIADTGVGIRPELVASLFQPFIQADTSLDRRDGGLGLGLAIVKGMVGLHGGCVEATSAGPGRGAQFTIRLPLDAPES